MNANSLLLWMSARVQGSWSQFRSAVEEFHIEGDDTGEDAENSSEVTGRDLPLYQSVRLGLQRLGHVEFFASGLEKGWCVVPPAMAISKQEGYGVGIFCGARFPALVEILNRVSSAISCDLKVIPGMPDRIRVVGSDTKEVLKTANQLGLATQIDAPCSLLTAIPPVDDPRSRSLSELPVGPGWTVERFSSTALRWEGMDSRGLNRKETNLFRFRMKYQRFYFLQWKGNTFYVQVQVGKYAVLRHRRVRNLISYDRENALLSFPVSCRPPMLIERAIILCSGLLPQIEPSSGRLEYVQVPENIARLAAALLCQEIQIL